MTVECQNLEFLELKMADGFAPKSYRRRCNNLLLGTIEADRFNTSVSEVFAICLSVTTRHSASKLLNLSSKFFHHVNLLMMMITNLL